MRKNTLTTITLLDVCFLAVIMLCTIVNSCKTEDTAVVVNSYNTVIEEYDFHATATSINKVKDNYVITFIDGEEQGTVVVQTRTAVTINELIHVRAYIIEDAQGTEYIHYTLEKK